MTYEIIWKTKIWLNPLTLTRKTVLKICIICVKGFKLRTKYTNC